MRTSCPRGQFIHIPGVTLTVALAIAGLSAASGALRAQPSPRLTTRWTAQVTADRVLPEYPRPQMVRTAWQNLNGQWDYAIRDRAATAPAAFDGKILVPFAAESYLSGVQRPVGDGQRLWYRRTFRAPERPAGQRLLLHFGAIDWEATVFVNGLEIGAHRGGYSPFSFDITDRLVNGPDQELRVAVWDPADRGDQPRGKQVTTPKSIWYTSVTGIWQTVWLEPVPSAYINDLEIVPDIDASALRVRAAVKGARDGERVRVAMTAGDRQVGTANGAAGEWLTVRVASPRLWSPADPFLYTLRVSLSSGDAVESYAGMRKISVGRDASGVNRLMLNNAPLFQFGPLDQGWWPDGLYTAPTDEALRFDIEATRRLGFNLIRKHVKVEPARWYYHCDRLGMLVWQDMPSADNKTPEGRRNFELELKEMIDARRNAPSIVMWVPFNEGWGQHDAARYVDWLKNYDPTRLVNHASGWTDEKISDVADAHDYPGPAAPLPEPRRARVLGEFGGLGLPLEGHTWIDSGNWGYRSFKTTADLQAAYRDLLGQLRVLIGEGLSAAVYTQTTDVEIEVNGLMTYDRAVMKLPAEAADWNKRMYAPPPEVRTVVPASDTAPQTWRYTTDAPAGEWTGAAFDDGAWQQGPGGFGKTTNVRAKPGTVWSTPDLWLRRPFDVPVRPLVNPHLRIFHDDDAEVYVNGTRVAALTGANGGYAYIPLDTAVSALHPGRNTLAVHVRNTRGGQFIDVGMVEVVDR